MNLIATRTEQLTAAARYRQAVDARDARAAEDAWREFCGACGWQYSPSGAHAPRRVWLPARTILHWPGDRSSARDLQHKWIRNESGSRVSSHCGIDLTHVIWYRPPHVRCNHAAGANEDSIGIDICAPILARAGEAGAYDFRYTASNRGTHGGSVLPLDEQIAATVGRVRARLSLAIGHHLWVDHAYVEEVRKWDCRPWRPVLYRHRAIDLPDPHTDWLSPVAPGVYA